MIWFIILFLLVVFNIRSSKSSNIVCNPNHSWIYNTENVMVCNVCKKRPEDLM